ncbi:transposase [Streptomyces sp. NPDC001928]|uniref:transposase n=1 Tax=Streptomyces sp. NPDC001928 TaxID=3154404 RepID=UPI003318D302
MAAHSRRLGCAGCARCSTGLPDPQWEILRPMVLAVRPGGRPTKHTRREILNPLGYWLRAGCAWRLLPHDLPPWTSLPGPGGRFPG